MAAVIISLEISHNPLFIALNRRRNLCDASVTSALHSHCIPILQARAKDSLRRSGSISRPGSDPVHLDKGYSHNVGPTKPTVSPHYGATWLLLEDFRGPLLHHCWCPCVHNR